MSTCLGMTELCWGDVGLALSIPRQGLGNAAITAVADAEQKKRFEGVWAAMAITEPGAGSDSANIRTTARLDGDEWVLDGEKIYVTAGAGQTRWSFGRRSTGISGAPRSSRSSCRTGRRGWRWSASTRRWGSGRRTRRASP